ncbi:toll/interleukin-1 receptor domain-containing protein [Pantoea ananatis]|uniref:toll/interleukin-1 receptor domain-containing protein n=1 Tax=Pantoea ananas TaxID=553 RepID=UPI002235EF15|nr:toll/interleukin-1 receptor domain-containing protein [Pantoea ananatis]BBL32297.1 hypothetical protein PAFU01_37450 [Pantoea ananatis]
MKTDLFISYAWTSDKHREWVRLFASHLHIAGYIVKIDAAVNYGSNLEGFMREAVNSKHVLLIVDENYVHRANTMPDSGVGKENKWIREVFTSKPETWLSVVFIQNPTCQLPAWLESHKPKGFDFNSDSSKNDFPGAVQIDAVWRWIEDLPADNGNAVSLSTLRERAARLEHVTAMRDPARFTNPALKGKLSFTHQSSSYCHVGYGIYQFDIKFDQYTTHQIRMYNYGVKAIGQLPDSYSEPLDYKEYLDEEDIIILVAGNKALLLNADGIYCIVTIDKVIPKNKETKQKGVVEFSYEILHENKAIN